MSILNISILIMYPYISSNMIKMCSKCIGIKRCRRQVKVVHCCKDKQLLSRLTHHNSWIFWTSGGVLRYNRKTEQIKQGNQKKNKSRFSTFFPSQKVLIFLTGLLAGTIYGLVLWVVAIHCKNKVQKFK